MSNPRTTKKPVSKLRIDLEYNLPDDQKDELRCPNCQTVVRKEASTNPELTAHYIEFAIKDTHPKGLEGQKRRQLARIQKALDDAIDNGRKDITLETAERNMLRKAVRDCKVPAEIVKYFMIFETEVERAFKTDD